MEEAEVLELKLRRQLSGEPSNSRQENVVGYHLGFGGSDDHLRVWVCAQTVVQAGVACPVQVGGFTETTCINLPFDTITTTPSSAKRHLVGKNSSHTSFTRCQCGSSPTHSKSECHSPTPAVGKVPTSCLTCTPPQGTPQPPPSEPLVRVTVVLAVVVGGVARLAVDVEEPQDPDDDHADAKAEEKPRPHGHVFGPDHAFHDLGGDVEEDARGEAQHAPRREVEAGPRVGVARDAHSDDDADKGGSGRNEVGDQGDRHREACANEDAEVGQLLRKLVEDHRGRDDPAEVAARAKRRRDGNAVKKVVEEVAHENVDDDGLQEGRVLRR
mmetsp:Transcript_27799/g.67794  ORF Transcript_27799/g.67794 Transcript_27799/m.67794 type:complete len:327 (+) Transcript_27799:1167-2147(+)